MKNPPTLSASTKANFATLQRASGNGDLALVSAIRKSDQKPVSLICAINAVGNEFEFVPLAVMVDGNPYELFEDPTVVADEKSVH